MSQDLINSYILLSITFVFSLFALQFVSPRILYFHPFNSHVQSPTFHFDTFLLFLFTILAGVSFFLGIAAQLQIDPLICIEVNLRQYVLWIFFILVLLLPLYLKLFGKTQIRKGIAEGFKSKIFQHPGKCNACGNENAIYENIVLEWNDLRIRRTCKHCDGKESKEFRTNLVIG